MDAEGRAELQLSNCLMQSCPKEVVGQGRKALAKVQ